MAGAATRRLVLVGAHHDGGLWCLPGGALWPAGLSWLPRLTRAGARTQSLEKYKRHTGYSVIKHYATLHRFNYSNKMQRSKWHLCY